MTNKETLTLVLTCMHALGTYLAITWYTLDMDSVSTQYVPELCIAAIVSIYGANHQ